jgi:hypothetical protein
MHHEVISSLLQTGGGAPALPLLSYWSMIRKSGCRFSEKIVLNKKIMPFCFRAM